MKVKVAQLCPTFCDPIPCDSLGQNTGVGSLSFLQGIFPTEGSISGLPHCRWIIYQLSHQEKFKAMDNFIPTNLFSQANITGK